MGSLQIAFGVFMSGASAKPADCPEFVRNGELAAIELWFRADLPAAGQNVRLYRGARAEKSGFNIILQRDFDASAGSAELFPQEITRALLNLISNGFCAATKRNSEGEAGFEPTLLAATKSLGDSMEIRIRGNGAGIPEIEEKIFNPFFTTKPAGEGTGLGLSMSHDIIVKQHGGTIRVNTEPAHSQNSSSRCREPYPRKAPNGAQIEHLHCCRRRRTRRRRHVQAAFPAGSAIGALRDGICSVCAGRVGESESNS
jgi:signal transduction histidine kinase